MKQIIKNNKEVYPNTGDWKSKLPVVSDKCTACKKCVQHCPEATMFMGKIGGKERAGIKYDFCKGCGICAEVCPVKAIKMIDKK
jgi:pyruvate ferredoxin oxidoreductase delta subunit